jgi:adenosine deaminase
VAGALDLTGAEVAQLARNSFTASFLPGPEVAARIAAVDRYAADHGLTPNSEGPPTPP